MKNLFVKMGRYTLLRRISKSDNILYLMLSFVGLSLIDMFFFLFCTEWLYDFESIEYGLATLSP